MELAAVVAELREIAQALRATAGALQGVVGDAARVTRPESEAREAVRSAVDVLVDEIERARRRGRGA